MSDEQKPKRSIWANGPDPDQTEVERAELLDKISKEDSVRLSKFWKVVLIILGVIGAICGLLFLLAYLLALGGALDNFGIISF